MINFITNSYKLIAGVASTVSILGGAGYYVNDVVSNLATKADIQHLQNAVDRINGEDRIFQLRPGYTYVLEPVGLDSKTIIINAQARRTTDGANCTYVGSVGLFEDDRGIPMVGASVGQGRQLSTRYEPIQAQYELPPSLRPGRVVVTMQLNYIGGEGCNVENSEPIPFLLQE